MQKVLAYFLIIGFILCGFMLILLPYPAYNSGTFGLSGSDISKINSQNEKEDFVDFVPQPIISALEWDSCVKNLMQKDKIYTAFDLEKGRQFDIVRKGGVSHADILAADKESLTLLNGIFMGQKGYKKGILVKLADNLWSAASICYNEKEEHFCLYFKGSRCHATNLCDPMHEKVIKDALSLAKRTNVASYL